jgi:hypothetical protein
MRRTAPQKTPTEFREIIGCAPREARQPSTAKDAFRISPLAEYAFRAVTVLRPELVGAWLGLTAVVQEIVRQLTSESTCVTLSDGIQHLS